MSSIIRYGGYGDTLHGISVFGRGVFTNEDEDDPMTYAGQHRDGYACGLGVVTHSNGYKEYAEHGPDGRCDGRNLIRSASGHTWYCLVERGKVKDRSHVRANGTCEYNGVVCAPDDPRLLALIAQVGPVEVRPAAPALHPPLARHLPPSNRPMDRPARFAPVGAGDRRGHRGAPPTPHAVAGGRATQPNSSRTAPHDHAVPRARIDLP
jgi:hypothetical protein